MENNLPHPEDGRPMVDESFLSYHLTVAFPNFIKTRPKHIKDVLDNFNLFGLLKNLFSPYKRMTVSGKVSLGEKLSYNIISILVGAMARTGLAIAGILVTIFFTIFDILSIPFYFLFPVFSFIKHSEEMERHVTTEDIAKKTISHKLTKTQIYYALASFFDSEFQNLFTIFPDPASLGIKSGQKTYEAFLQLSNWPQLDTYLKKIGVKTQDFQTLVKYLYEYLYSEKVAKPVPLGEMLIFGYTNTLEKFGRELTKENHPPFYGKHEILTKIEKILNRPQNNNVILTGEPGVGKHSVLDALASAIVKGQLPTIHDKRIVLLDIVALLATSQQSSNNQNQPQTKNPTTAQSNFESILEEAKRAGNIILAIDDLDRICTNLDGRTDLSEVLTSVLTDNSLPLIGLSTTDNFNAYIRPNANMTSLFERLDVEEPAAEELLTILVGHALQMYSKQKVATSFTAILELIDKSNKLMADKKQPEKSILVLEDAAAQAKSQKLNQVTVEIVDSILSEKTKTPVGKITQTEAKKLTDLEQILHKRIVGQAEAIEEISRAMRRARADLKKSARPMGSFLFLGPTGVGKTETAKALAQVYFGEENRMVRFDMTEFQGTDALTRLIGNPNTKSPGQLATQIRENPFGILLVDEFEKASKDVQNLFLQILDEGNMTDAFGKKVSFSNIIVIATSNAAAEYIREQVELNSTDLPKKLVDYVLDKSLFSPELINRFDAAVVYKPLTGEEVIQVAYLMLQNLARDLKENKNISLEITPDVAALVAKEGYVAAFGARPIRRLIQDKIEDQIAKLLIAGKLKNGDVVPSQILLGFLS